MRAHRRPGREPRDKDRVTACYEPSPLLAGDPAAVPVLRELLHAPDCKARRVAATGLAAIGPQARAAVPELVDIAESTPDYALHVCACEALYEIDPHHPPIHSRYQWAAFEKPPRSFRVVARLLP